MEIKIQRRKVQKENTEEIPKKDVQLLLLKTSYKADDLPSNNRRCADFLLVRMQAQKQLGRKKSIDFKLKMYCHKNALSFC